MESKDLKDLLVVNLTATLAFTTFPLFPDIHTQDSQINLIVVAYWLCFALLLIAYLFVNINEEWRNKNSQQLLEKGTDSKYYTALMINLACMAAIVAALVLCSMHPVALYWMRWILLIPYMIEIWLIFSYIYATISAFGFHSVQDCITSGYHYIEDKIGNPIILVVVATVFDIVIYLFVQIIKTAP